MSDQKMVVFYLCLNIFMNPGMDGWMDHSLETLCGNSDHDHDDVDVTSWVSVCPRGLWKVQQKRTGEGIQPTVSNSGDDACTMLFI